MSLSRTPLYQELASLITARNNCIKSNNGERLDKHGASIEHLVRNYMPSGSGIDCGTKLDLDASKPNRLVFYFSYHHMNDVGMYDSWTEHTLIVTPSLISGIDLRITGRDRNQIKEYLYETYQYCLMSEVWQTQDGVWHSEMYERPGYVSEGGGI